MSEFVTLKDVRKIYKMGEVEIMAAAGIDFEIKKGEFAVVVGPSGAGKTTVLNILGGMDTATSGQVLVDGQDIATYSTKQLTAYRRDDIGFVFQFYNLIPNLTALENVELALQICKDQWMHRKFWKKLDWEKDWIIFRRSCREENSRECRSQGHWQRIRSCYSAMNRPVHWIIIQENPF